MKISNLFFKAAVIGSLACSAAFAQGAFVGGSGGYNFNSGNKLTFSDAHFKDNAFALGVKGGYDFDIVRVYGEYIYNTRGENTKGDGKNTARLKWTSHKFLVGADVTPSINENFKALAGVYTGITQLNLNASASNGLVTFSGSDHGRDWTIGTKVGGIYSFDGKSEFEVGLRYDRTKFKVHGVDDKIKNTNAGAYLGYNFKF